MLDFTGKTIIVTGAGKGIGRGLTVKLVELGAHVIAISRTQADLDHLSNELGGGVTPIALDLADWEAVEKVVTPELVKNATGLVNNAAVARLARFVDCDKDEFDALMNINVKSMMQMSQIVAKGDYQKMFIVIQKISDDRKWQWWKHCQHKFTSKSSSARKSHNLLHHQGRRRSNDADDGA